MLSKTTRRASACLLLACAMLAVPQAAMAQNPAAQADAGQGGQITIGGGVLLTESPFNGEGTLANPIPIISAQFGPAYIDGLEAGLTFEPLGGPVSPFASAFVAARMTPARDRQDFTADAGVRVGVRGVIGELSGEVRRDITGEFKGTEYQVRYAYPINLGDLTIIPSAQVNWLDKETANHMYGVTAEQRAKAISKGREVILPVAPITEKAMNLGGGLTATYALGGGLTLIGVLKGTYLDKAIYKSPAIDQEWESTAVIGLTYSF